MREARAKLEAAEEQLGGVQDALSAVRLVLNALQPAHNGVQGHLFMPLLDAGFDGLMPFPANTRADYAEDAFTLRWVADRIATIVLDNKAFEKARQTPGELDDLVETAFVACINLRDFSYPSWPRVRREHLARGYEIVAAGRYVLYGVTRGDSELPQDTDRFPQLPRP